MFALAGYKARRVNEEGEEVFSDKEIFPEGNPAKQPCFCAGIAASWA